MLPAEQNVWVEKSDTYGKVFHGRKQPHIRKKRYAMQQKAPMLLPMKHGRFLIVLMAGLEPARLVSRGF